MKILVIAHVGETFGHLARALSVARELSAHGCSIDIAAAPRAANVIGSSGLRCDFHPVSWDWSHNSCELDGLSSAFLSRIIETTEDLMKVVERSRPDFILGMPGVASTQIARYYGIPHASVIHGPHLAPLVNLENATSIELAVLNISRKVCLGPLNDAFHVLNRILGLPLLDYQSYIRSETIYVPQPGLPIPEPNNMLMTNFIRASLGPVFDGDPNEIEGSCYVTFGSGNPCDIARVILLARQVFSKVIANTGDLSLGPFPDGVVIRPFVASSSLVGRVAAVVSHGGIGTVGTFAEWGTPQLIIPTEVDQATMAVHACRAGLATHVGLESFVNRSRLGRQLPNFSDDELLTAMDQMWNNQSSSAPLVPSAGAEEIASGILSHAELNVHVRH